MSFVRETSSFIRCAPLSVSISPGVPTCTLGGSVRTALFLAFALRNGDSSFAGGIVAFICGAPLTAGSYPGVPCRDSRSDLRGRPGCPLGTVAIVLVGVLLLGVFRGSLWKRLVATLVSSPSSTRVC
jgi:hypothetical protein